MKNLEIQERFDLVVPTNFDVRNLLFLSQLDYVNSGITSQNFPIKERGMEGFELALFASYDYINTEEVIEAISARGYGQANIEHLLVLSWECPDIQRRGNPILGFGTLWKRAENEIVAPVLRGGDNDRNMHLLRINNRWNPYDRFAGVKILKTPEDKLL